MALTVETGEGLTAANSFVSLAEVRAFASARSRTVSAVDATLEASILLAHDYILGRETRFQGQRTVEAQGLPFPRLGVTLFGRTFAKDAIPVQLKNAVCQLVLDSATTDLMPVADGKVITQETLGPISTSYAVTGASSAKPVLPRVEAYLAPLYSSQGFGLTSVRV